MEFGIGYFATHDGVDPGAFARLVEQRGHESLFFPEHTHIPASRETPYPAGGELPRKYSHSYDLFVALSTAAATSSKLRIGSGICLVIERDPITTAKEVASVDHLSGGRLEFGVGAGWNREEMLNHGTDPRVRMAIMAERIEAMKAIWTQDEASYHGESRELRAHLVLAEARAAAASAGARRRQRPDGARPRPALRRCVAAQLHRAKTCSSARASCGRGRIARSR